MKKGIGFAHGKIILIGEHAVVYNSYAISLPISKINVVTTVFKSLDTNLISSVYKGKLVDAPDELIAITSLIKELENHFSIGALTYEIKSAIPISSGMGSSAAIASSIVMAVYDYLGLELINEERLNWIAYAEKLAHGNPSGIDGLTTTFNDCWLFKRSVAPLKINLNLPCYLVISETDLKGITKEAVSLVKKAIDEENKRYLIDEIDNQVKLCYQGIKDSNISIVADAINIAQKALKSLNISTKTIDEMVEIALSNNALAAKLTGGGLGGCVIALCDTLENANKVNKAWENYIEKPGWVIDLKEL